MPDALIAGHRLTGRSRAGELGVWYEAWSPGGAPAGLLRFDPGPVGDPAARERLVAEVRADRRLTGAGAAGLLPIADLVAARGEVWLIAAAPGMPSLAELLAGDPAAPGPGAGGAATVLAETAQALLSVHAAGLAHGSLHPGTVLVTPDGTARLAERGLAAALRGEPATAERDVAAWAALATALSARWAADRPAAAELFDHVSRVAAAHGLAAARDTLLAHRDRLGLTPRERLAETVRRWTAASPPPRSPTPESSPRPADPGDEAVTLLRLPGEPPGTGTPGTAAGTAQEPPRSGESGGSAETVLRFGPGVPATTTAAQIWRTGRDHQATLPAPERLAAVRHRRRRRRQGRQAAFSAIVLALMAAGIVLAWLFLPRGGTALTVTGVEVRGPRTLGCDGTATFIGVITTNGAGGTIRYQWRQSDGQANREQTRTVASGETATRVPLRWSVSGPGRERFTATLRVLSPVPDGKPIEDKATFSYRC